LQIRKTCRNPKAFAKLPRHEQFPIANRYDFAIGNAMNRVHMLVSNLAATDDRDSQGARSCSLGSHNLEIRYQTTEGGRLKREVSGL
jgi:hypothetical protein